MRASRVSADANIGATAAYTTGRGTHVVYGFLGRSTFGLGVASVTAM